LLTAPTEQHAPASLLAHSRWPGATDATLADETSLLGAAEQDAQDQARDTATAVAPASLRPRSHFVTLTVCRFLPVSRNRLPSDSGVARPT
jgi:hypothetical protein